MKCLPKLLGLVAVLLSTAPLSALDHMIGVALMTKDHQFTRDLADEIALRCREHGLLVDIQYAEYDLEKQNRILDGFLQRRYEAVLLTPVDSLGIDAAIVRLNSAGIPVFTVDIANEGRRGQVVSHIASDNFQGGVAAAGLMAEALKGQGKVVIINHPKVTSVQERVAGFRQGLTGWPLIEIVADIPSWGQRSRATSIMDDFAMMMPDIQGVFAINDDSLMGALKSIQAFGKTRKVVLVGYDGTPEARAEIEKGTVFADVVQYPRELARKSLAAISDFLAGKTIARKITIPVGTVRK